LWNIDAARLPHSISLARTDTGRWGSSAKVDSGANQPRLRDVFHAVIRTRGYSRRTEKAYWYWTRYFVRFHNMRHPRAMGAGEVRKFLTWLAVERNVAPATQNQALNALIFLYAHVLGQPLGIIGDTVRAKRPRKLPIVLTHAEAMATIDVLEMPYRLMAALMYGAGLRVVETTR